MSFHGGKSCVVARAAVCVKLNYTICKFVEKNEKLRDENPLVRAWRAYYTATQGQ